VKTVAPAFLLKEVKVDEGGANSRQPGGSHYKNKKIQTWDYIVENNIPYLEGNIIKYVSRWREKGGISDLEKAQHYLEKLLEVERRK
jgi:hypothetical protein